MMNSPPDNNLGNPSTPEASPPSKLWTTKEVAHFLDVSPKTVFNLRKKGLPCVYLGGAVRFVPNEISTYLTTNRGLALHRLRQIRRKGPSA
jgi:predicted DNA-binding transcriptional regulator AlpA